MNDPLAAFVDMLATAVAEKLGRKPTLTRAEVCAEFGLTVRQVRALESRGLPVRRAGHARLYLRADVERWLGGEPIANAPDRDAVSRRLLRAWGGR